MQFKKVFAAARWLASLASTSAAANLVTNGDFEAGNTGWFKTPNTFIAEILPFAHSGIWVAGTSCAGEECVSTAGGGSYLEQTLTTAANSLCTR